MVKPDSRDVLLLLISMVLTCLPVGSLQMVLPLYLSRAGLESSLNSLSGLVTASLVAFSDTRGGPRRQRWIPDLGDGAADQGPSAVSSTPKRSANQSGNNRTATPGRARTSQSPACSVR